MGLGLIGGVILGTTIIANASTVLLNTHTNVTGQSMPYTASYTSYSTHRAFIKAFPNYASVPTYSYSSWATPGNTARVSTNTALRYVEKYGENM